MGWLHNLNLKRKVIDAMTNRPHLPRTVADLSRETSAREAEVEDLLQHMERKGMVVSSPAGTSWQYRLHEAEETMRKTLKTLSNAEPGNEGMTLRADATGWTAELNEPAGLLVHGDTRQQAVERGRTLMRRISSLPGASSVEAALGERH